MEYAMDKEPTQRTKKGLEIPVPTRTAWDDTLSKVVRPVKEAVDSAEQESELPADETDEG